MKGTGTVAKLNNFFHEGKQMYFKENETIITRDALKPKYIYFLKKGFVHQYTMTQTKTINMNVFKPNSYFPVINIFGNLVNKYSYEAISEVETYAVSKNKFTSFIKDNPDVMYDLASRLSKSLDMMAQVIEALMSFDSSNKVIRILLSIASRFGVDRGQETVINIPLTHMDIANMVGISRETVTREIGGLTKKRFIRKEKGKYVLRKLAMLKRRIKD